ncbi:hypothetical protein BWQ96_05539 [Gracilariopsis chorda]|uniref:Uncharacterized protein n=1 Tax=Gracilariopsis chorda TaxID=448386 RepID=A0A2V3IRD4_9FLOR|nr:hypothetical protein BWQ96_05539 [Gracilariopsis chorda]|eukprot:PXF44682.1 hypothetical protein BWQ96_05539 [Gracilariopsis chorda]
MGMHPLSTNMPFAGAMLHLQAHQQPTTRRAAKEESAPAAHEHPSSVTHRGVLVEAATRDYSPSGKVTL